MGTLSTKQSVNAHPVAEILKTEGIFVDDDRCLDELVLAWEKLWRLMHKGVGSERHFTPK